MRLCRLILFSLRVRPGSRQVSFSPNANTQSGWSSDIHFNPPHIIPLVEVVGGTNTSPDAIQQAISFYASIGKRPIHLKKELPGHVANRFQAALYREMLYVIEQGILRVEEADAAVCYGP